MALTSTTLASDLSGTSNTAVLTSGTGFAAGQMVKIDGEYARVASVSGATVKLMQRGANGTAVVAHDLLSRVLTTTDNADWTGLQAGAETDRPPFVDDVLTVGENGAIACPTRNTTIVINKATALASSTLADPPLDRDGLRITVTSATDAAHVVTGNFADGTTGSHTTLTCAAFNGASAIVVAQQGLWNVIGTEGITVG